MHVCLFDIDGTLLNTRGAGQAAMEAALRSEFSFTSPVEGIPTAGRTDRAIVRDLIDYCGLDHNEETLRRFYHAYLEHLPGQLEVGSGLVLPGVVKLLKLLTVQPNVLVGLLTGNYREGARLKLVHFGIHDYFADVGGFGDQHESRDDVAREALRRLEQYMPEAVNIERVWVIGDTPADVRCAQAIGARSFAVATGNYALDELLAENPDYAVDDLSDIQTFLAAVNILGLSDAASESDFLVDGIDTLS